MAQEKNTYPEKYICYECGKAKFRFRQISGKLWCEECVDRIFGKGEVCNSCGSTIEPLEYAGDELFCRKCIKQYNILPYWAD